MEAKDIEQVEALNAFLNQHKEFSKLTEAIGKGNNAIKKLSSGKIEELRELVGPLNSVDETKDYLQNEGEIDYSKVPNIDLSLTSPNSKSARNPELLKTLNCGQDENLRRLAQRNSRSMHRVDKDLRYNISNRPDVLPNFRPNPMSLFGPNQGSPFNNNFQKIPNFEVSNTGPVNFDRPVLFKCSRSKYRQAQCTKSFQFQFCKLWL
uniref:Uncharacterized protein n=1 Tax=Vespula pensylvanica TaxID=30213 RepID=A0A834UF20_VESPE|nr:hypothetical protein H0235_003227 [Vespula pensylvanica]